MIDSAGEKLLTQATELHQSGDFPAAEKIYRQIWQQRPTEQIGYLLGTLLLQTGEYQQAIEYLQPIANNHPEDADVHNNLGLACFQLNQIPQARQAFEQAIVANPEYGQAYWNMAKLCAEISDGLLAEANFELASKYLPDSIDLRWEWSYCLMQSERWEKAVVVLSAIQQQQIPPQLQREMLLRLAFLFAKLKRYREAILIYELLLSQDSGSAQILSNLSYLYERTGQIELAIDRAEQALRKNPNRPEMLNNRGIAYRSAHRLAEAERDFRLAIEINPDFALAKFNLGSLQLMQEQYPVGWSGYEAREKIFAPSQPPADQPYWQGEPLVGGTLLIENDQGFGDALQFLRFLPLFQQKSQAQLLLRLQEPLLQLVRDSMQAGLLPTVPVRGITADVPRADRRVALASAGFLFQLTRDDLHTEHPYLRPATQDIASLMNQRFNGEDLKIGLCWRGNPDQAQDHIRSLPFSQLLAVREIPNMKFHSLQLDISEHEKQQWPELIDHAQEMTSFAETARLLQSLDLLITVDTAVCHLAGGMHFPAWTLLTHTPDWRWHLHRTDSPWYPRMRLFRQPEWGDWNSVMQQVVREISVWASLENDKRC